MFTKSIDKLVANSDGKNYYIFQGTDFDMGAEKTVISLNNENA